MRFGIMRTVMENTFAELLKAELDGVKTLSENGAVMNGTTGSKMLDCWYKLSSMRSMSCDEIRKCFAEAFYENPHLAKRFLFYVLDVRGGAGERRAFTTMFDWLVDSQIDNAKPLLRLIPVYGRWDLLTRYAVSAVGKEAVGIIKGQLTEDVRNDGCGKGVSLLAKWLPSENCSSAKSRKLACTIRRGLNLGSAEYRKVLSRLRKRIGIVERDISANRWNEVDYSKVPSKANILYKDAFMRHDKVRREKFLEDLKSGGGDVKINSSACFPHDIVYRYRSANRILGEDPTLEEMWKALPDRVNGDGTTLVVRDGSGSMLNAVGRKGNGVTAWDVATALAIYFSERCCGAFKDKFITFSSRPRMLDLGKCDSLRKKINFCCLEDECTNTDFAKTMDLVLKTAVNNSLKQSDIPSLLVISDMEFDDGVSMTTAGNDVTLMEEISAKFRAAGYELPKIAYWNVCNRSGGIPCSANDSGVTILSGFSPAVLKMASGEYGTPYDALCAMLNDSRYDAVTEA